MAKKPAKAKPSKTKPKTKAKAKTKAVDKVPAAAVASREQTVSIRKIENGYITRTSGMIGEKGKERYVEHERFSRTAPKVTIPKETKR